MSDAYLKTAAKQFSQTVQPYELEVDHVTYDSGDKIEVTVIASPSLSNEEKYTFDITKRNPEELAWGGDHETFQLRIDLTAGSSTSPEVKSAVLKAFKDVQHKNWNNDGQDWDDATKDNIIVENKKFLLDTFALPDGVKHRYDATSIDAQDGDTLSSWTDEAGSADLGTGDSPTYKTDVINGQPVVSHDGSDAMSASFDSSLSQPVHIFVVFQTSSGNDSYYYDGGSGGNEMALRAYNSNDWEMRAGSNLTDGSVDSNPHIFGNLYNGGSSEMRIDGSSVVTGDVGTSSVNGFTTADNGSGGFKSQTDIGEVVIYDRELSDSEISDVESVLSDKWGITI